MPKSAKPAKPRGKFVESPEAGIKVTKDAPLEVAFRFDPEFERTQKWVRSARLVPANTGASPE